jgi:hypothetical protein
MRRRIYPGRFVDVLFADWDAVQFAPRVAVVSLAPGGGCVSHRARPSAAESRAGCEDAPEAVRRRPNWRQFAYRKQPGCLPDASAMLR